jgi:PKD domain-containing protein/type IX secretion system substrate protein
MKEIKSYHLRIFLLLAFLLVYGTSKADSLRVLFLGNSHTFWHDVPQLVTDLAFSQGDTIFYEANTPGGCTLGHPENGHLYNPISLVLIDSIDWDFVILQEHSLFGVIDYYRNKYMYPGGKSLDSLIKINNPCTETIIQLIWGKKNAGQYCMNGHCSDDFKDFAEMQDSLTAEYKRFADSLHFTLAPAGPAWKQSVINGDPIELFDPDGSHPSLAGSYLAACVYYAVLFQKSPVGSLFTGGLSLADAQYFQQIANDVVFADSGFWNINANQAIAGFEVESIGSTVFCTDTSTNADYYAWDFGDGTSDTVSNPAHNYTTSGTFVITQEVSNTLCYSDVSTDTISVTVSSLNKYSASDPDIDFFYNPSSDNISVFLKQNGILQINIFGLDGRRHYSKKLNGQKEFTFNLSPMPPGLYFLSVRTKEGENTFKLLL